MPTVRKSDSHRWVFEICRGNRTLIERTGGRRKAVWYAKRGRCFLEKFKKYNIEQVGFYLRNSLPYLRMSGSEFCLNATHGMAVLLSLQGYSGPFRTSGFRGKLNFDVSHIGASCYSVEVRFSRRLIRSQSKIQYKNLDIDVVRIPGIAHYLIEGSPPVDPKAFAGKVLSEIAQREEYSSPAMGLIWYQVKQAAVAITPIVWVRTTGSLIEETACGSGSVAVTAHTGVTKITQPSGEVFGCELKGQDILTKSEVGIVAA